MIGKELKIFSSDDFPSELPRLNELYDSLFAEGKGFRGQLVMQMADLVSLKEKEKHLLAQTIEFIHNSSLLHDDFIDNSSLRRGKTAAWKEFGPEYAVLAGDYLLARVMVNLARQGHIKLVEVTAESISDLLEGEWLQDSIRHQEGVSQQTIQKIHELKTSSLFSWCLKAPFVYKNANAETIQILSDIGKDLGLLLQRSDDLLDFDIRNFENKTTFTDLKAGFLNSFSVHLFAEKKWTQKFYTIESMKDVLKYITQEEFNERLKLFDEKNQLLINKIIKGAEVLTKVGETPLAFFQLIKDMTPQLYWRK